MSSKLHKRGNLFLLIGLFPVFLSEKDQAIWAFSKKFEESVIGNLFAGGDVLIVYDAARLPGRDTRYGQRAWDIYAEFQFNGGEVHQQLLQGPELIEGTCFIIKVNTGDPCTRLKCPCFNVF